MPLLSGTALLGLIVGLFIERKGYAKPAWNRLASQLLVQLIYPCLIFSSLLTRFEWQEVQALALMPLLVFSILGIGLALGKLTVAKSGLKPDASQRSYVFLAGMPNYSFVPLVIAQTFWGEKGLALVAIASVGADIFLWLVAFPQMAGYFAWQRVFSPALLSLCLALLLLFVRFPMEPKELWAGGLNVMKTLGMLTLPLSMYILGTQLARASHHMTHTRAHGFLLLWRLGFCPLLMVGLLLLFGSHLPTDAQAVLLLIASMPGAIVTVVLAEIYAADGPFAATQILIGHLAAIVTVGMWQGLFYFFLA